MDQQKISKFLLEVRKQKGMTQKELAEKVGISDRTISKWECGIGLPDINNIEMLADALDVSLLELMQAQRNESRDNNISAKKAEELLMDTIKFYYDKIFVTMKY